MTQMENREYDIVGDIESRRGVYANAAFITSQGSEDIIDFVLTDGINNDGCVTGVLASRIVLTHETLLQLKKTIDGHIQQLDGAHA